MNTEQQYLHCTMCKDVYTPDGIMTEEAAFKKGILATSDYCGDVCFVKYLVNFVCTKGEGLEEIANEHGYRITNLRLNSFTERIKRLQQGLPETISLTKKHDSSTSSTLSQVLQQAS